MENTKKILVRYRNAGPLKTGICDSALEDLRQSLGDEVQFIDFVIRNRARIPDHVLRKYVLAKGTLVPSAIVATVVRCYQQPPSGVNVEIAHIAVMCVRSKISSTMPMNENRS